MAAPLFFCSRSLCPCFRLYINTLSTLPSSYLRHKVCALLQKRHVRQPWLCLLPVVVQNSMKHRHGGASPPLWKFKNPTSYYIDSGLYIKHFSASLSFILPLLHTWSSSSEMLVVLLHGCVCSFCFNSVRGYVICLASVSLPQNTTSNTIWLCSLRFIENRSMISLCRVNLGSFTNFV
jgi:hypothetical protein